MTGFKPDGASEHPFQLAPWYPLVHCLKALSRTLRSGLPVPSNGPSRTNGVLLPALTQLSSSAHDAIQFRPAPGPRLHLSALSLFSSPFPHSPFLNLSPTFSFPFSLFLFYEFNSFFMNSIYSHQTGKSPSLFS